jgi:hypothetical protein
MRIVSVRLAPVTLILAILYAVFGLVAFAVYAVGTEESLTLPFGVLGPLFHLNPNLHLARSGGLLYNVFLCVSTVLSYGATGWITGGVGAFCFNVIAKQTGGIDAKYVIAVSDHASGKSAV